MARRDAGQDTSRLLSRLRSRVFSLVARAVVQLIDDSQQLQTLQITILDDESRDRVERFQQYGFTAHPHPGAEAVALSVAGSRGHILVIAVDDRRYRKRDLEPGESAQYSDEGDYFLLKRGRIAELVAGTKFTADTPLAEFTGLVDAVESINTADVFKVAGTQVVGAQQGAVAAPVGGATQDTQARTAINDIRAVLSAHGLTA